MSDIQQAEGTIWAVFGHRLAIEGASGRILVDLGPKGAETLSLSTGDTIKVEGTRKPSEIKVTTLTLADGTVHPIDWDAPHAKADQHEKADPDLARQALRQAGYHPVGEPKRKPKHFELRGTREGQTFEVHVGLDGAIRKTKSVQAETAHA